MSFGLLVSGSCSRLSGLKSSLNEVHLKIPMQTKSKLSNGRAKNRIIAAISKRYSLLFSHGKYLQRCTPYKITRTTILSTRFPGRPSAAPHCPKPLISSSERFHSDGEKLFSPHLTLEFQQRPRATDRTGCCGSSDGCDDIRYLP
jgi:hypothetical protein